MPYITEGKTYWLPDTYPEKTDEWDQAQRAKDITFHLSKDADLIQDGTLTMVLWSQTSICTKMVVG